MDFTQQFMADAMSAHLEYCKKSLKADLFCFLQSEVPEMPLDQVLRLSQQPDELNNLLRSAGNIFAADKVASYIITWEKQHNNERIEEMTRYRVTKNIILNL